MADLYFDGTLCDVNLFYNIPTSARHKQSLYGKLKTGSKFLIAYIKGWRIDFNSCYSASVARVWRYRNLIITITIIIWKMDNTGTELAYWL